MCIIHNIHIQHLYIYKYSCTHKKCRRDFELYIYIYMYNIIYTYIHIIGQLK